MLVLKRIFWEPNFGMVSITIDPEHDTAKVPTESLGVKSANWNF
jgi:protein SCO1/2